MKKGDLPYDHGVSCPGVGVSGLLTPLLCLHPHLHQICGAGNHDCQGTCRESCCHLTKAAWPISLEHV